jgi:hypothetical protein
MVQQRKYGSCSLKEVRNNFLDGIKINNNNVFHSGVIAVLVSFGDSALHQIVRSVTLAAAKTPQELPPIHLIRLDSSVYIIAATHSH